MTDSGHIPAKETRKEMPEILKGRNKEGNKKYDILLSLGRGWQNKKYENVDSGNAFWGEPRTGSITPFVFGFSDQDLKWGITYSFSGMRDSVFTSNKGRQVTYGASGMNMDRLYYILVNAFNHGEDFVQKYLNDVAPVHLGSEIKKVIEPALEEFRNKVLQQTEMNEERLNEAVEAEDIINQAESHIAKTTGEIDRRYRYGGKRLSDIVTSARERLAKFYEDLDSGKFRIKGKTWKSESERVAELLRKDFANSMNNGEVPLAKTFLSEKTKKLRRRLGLNDSAIFSASSQFVKSIEFKVRIKNG